MPSSRITTATALCVGAALLAACGSTSGATSRSGGSSPSPTRVASSEAAGSDPALPAPVGYSYVAAPAGFAGLKTTFDAMGMTSSVTVKGVLDGTGRVSSVILVAQYSPRLTLLMDKEPVPSVLAGAARVASALLYPRTWVELLVDHGHPVRLLMSRSFDIAFAYIRGGRLIEVFGPAPGPIESFIDAYLGGV